MDRCERSVIATLVNTKMTFNYIGGATTGSIDGYVFTTNATDQHNLAFLEHKSVTFGVFDFITYIY